MIRKKRSISKAAVLGVFALAVWAGAVPAFAATTEPAPVADKKIVAGSGQTGDENGAALSASFREPSGIVVLPDGAAYIADSANHSIRKLAAGLVSDYAGLTVSRDAKGLPEGMWLDGPLNQSMFQQPQGMAADAQGNLYIADTGNHVIRKITTQGTVTTLAGDGVQGYQDGTGKAARFYSPGDLAVAADGTIYVADTLNHAIRKITADGKVTTLNSLSERTVQLAPGYVERAGDFRDGKLKQAKFNEPSGIAIDGQGNLYVSDTGNQRIRYIDLKNGTVATVAGAATLTYPQDSLYAEGGQADGAASSAQFRFPKGIAVTAEGGLVIADSRNHAIRYLHNGKVTTLASSFDQPVDVAATGQGSIWVTDWSAQTISQVSLPPQSK
ncbi:hypothetical protein [Brevibacillus parabrevis]|uniref:hypothetical protein n=1 Tax=Brevibacillus parabrevis TaxID=54914 RepID=UPI0028D7504C|nr:hypothetical protein [Brevibacillus parabrevis]